MVSVDHQCPLLSGASCGCSLEKIQLFHFNVAVNISWAPVDKSLVVFSVMVLVAKFPKQ